MSTAAPQLSVVIPAFNEEARLPGTLEHARRYLEGLPWDAELIIVDDGSTDATADVVADSHSDGLAVTLLRQEGGGHRGKGAAVRLGMLAASGLYRLFMDADGSTPIEQLKSFWPCFEAGGAIVVGSRGVPGSRILRAQALPRRLAGRFGNLLIRTLLVPGIRDTQAGFKMFTARAADDVFASSVLDGWGFDFEVLAIARARGYRIHEVPIEWSDVGAGKLRARDYLRVLRDVGRVWYQLERGAYDVPCWVRA